MTKVYDTATDLITFARLQAQNTTSGSSYLGSDGLLKFAAEDEPRIEYGSDGSLKGLLIEEQRANLILDSNDPTTVNWATKTTNASQNLTGPDGVANSAWTLEDADSSAFLQNRAAVTIATAAATYTISFYVLKDSNETRFPEFQVQTLDGTSETNFFRLNTATGAISVLQSTGGSYRNVEDCGNWWRISCDITNNGANSTLSFKVLPAGPSTLGGSGSPNDIGSIGFYGAQIEEGSFATSYIPTSGSTVTRSPDIASIPVSAFGYNQDAGTFVADYTPVTKQNQYAISVTTSFNYMALLWGNAGNAVRFQVTAGSATSAQLNTLTGTVAGTQTVHAGAYAANDFAACNDGGTVLTDTLGDVPSGLVQMKIGSEFGSYLNGHIKSIQYYPRRLTNTQLQELTS